MPASLLGNQAKHAPQVSIQLDKSTHCALESYLIAFARYEKDSKIKEKFLFSNTLSATTTAADAKALVDSFFEANELNWQNFKHICTDGAPAMISINLRFVTLVKNKWPHVTCSHCSLCFQHLHNNQQDSDCDYKTMK